MIFQTVSLLFLWIWLPLAVSSFQKYHHLELPTGAVGPESIAFDCKGKGPYTGVSDGRILKYQGPKRGWKNFAYTSPRRRRSLCDGSTNSTLGPICGRPLGLQFDKTCVLYVADAYYGLMKVRRKGGRAIPLASTAEGVPFKLTNYLDLDNENRIIYFTHSSSRFQKGQYSEKVPAQDKSGRLMKYDIRTKKVTVLLRGLFFANGAAISKKKDYVIVSEYMKDEIQKYWLKGPKANTSELFARPPGHPDNISKNAKGDFWVGLGNKNKAGEIIGVRYDEEGRILQRLLGDGVIGSVSEVEERNGLILVGTVVTTYIGITSV